MSRLLHDRFLAIADGRAWDLATGARVRLRHLLSRESTAVEDARLGVCIDSGATPDGGYFEAWEALRFECPEPARRDMETLLEALDQGADGEPRHVRLCAGDALARQALARAAAREARRRGYVTVSADLFEKVTRSLGDELTHRTVVIIDAAVIDRGASGDHGPGGVDPAEVLARAAALNPRPHVLVSIRERRHGWPALRRPWSLVREARAVYAAPDVATPEVATPEVAAPEVASPEVASPEVASPEVASPDIARHRARATVAYAAAGAGRHAQADRGLREVAAGLVRRRAWGEAARVQVMLGRVLLDRGRCAAADRALSDAVEAAERASNPACADIARVWLAAARIAADRQTLAESLLRAVRIARSRRDAARPGSPGSCGWMSAWVDAMLARCLLAQDRVGEAADVVSGFHVRPLHAAVEGAVDGSADGGVDTAMAADASDACVAALVRAGRLFEAGQICGELRSLVRSEASSESDPLTGPLTKAATGPLTGPPTSAATGERARAILALATLRIATAAGDCSDAAERLAQGLNAAASAHAPIAAMEARLLWLEMLKRAGRTAEFRREHQRLHRIARAAPPFLRRRIDGALTAAAGSGAADLGETTVRETAVALLRLGEDEDDRPALEQLAARLLGDLRAARIDIHVGAGEAIAPLVTSGSGLPARVSARALEAGIVIGPEEAGGAWECAAPIHAGNRTVASLACRWPVGRAVPGAGRAILEVAAAIAAPRVASLLQQRDGAARASLVVPELLGVSSAIEELRKAIARAAGAPFAVLVEGESGSGKELVARAIHQLSARRDHRLCDVNCAAIPDDLLESELFGHARGAFTGALVERRGLFEEADGGTLFLDELPDLSPRAQAKLLRVLQDGEVRRVGESFTRHVDVRIVAATNRSMADAVEAGQFRKDLLYRLDVIRLRLPPLRERPADIPLLARHFWSDASRRAATRAVLSHGALAALAAYHWPGNVRELQNVIASLAVAAPARGMVRAALLPSAITGARVLGATRLSDARLEFERRFVEIALARAGGSRTRTATELGVSRQGLVKLLARLKLAS